MSLAHALKQARPDSRIIYIGLKGDKLKGLEGRYGVFDEVYNIPAGKLRRYHGESLLAQLLDIQRWLLNLRDFFRVVAGIISADRLMRKIKPQAVFSKGSFVAVPVGIAARWHHIPLVTHDSDAQAGLANRLIGRWAKVHAVGMEAENYPYPKESVKYVGTPVDERIKPVMPQLQSTYRQQLNLEPESLVLLVGGAGLGSLSINQKVVSLAPKLLAAHPSLHIIHVTGTKHDSDIKKAYEEVLRAGQLKRLTVIGFTPDFYRYSGAADLIVTRAGATTIAELALQGKAAILIPAPFLTAGQQLKNAQELAKNQAAVIIDDTAPAEELLKTIGELLRDKKQRQELADKLVKFARPEAASELAKIIISVAESGAA